MLKMHLILTNASWIFKSYIETELVLLLLLHFVL